MWYGTVLLFTMSLGVQVDCWVFLGLLTSLDVFGRLVWAGFIWDNRNDWHLCLGSVFYVGLLYTTEV